MKPLSLLVVLFYFVQASAQQWYPSPAPNGRDINSIKILHPDTVIVAGGWKLPGSDTSSAVFLSENGGLYLWNVPVFPGGGYWITSVDFTDSENGIAVGDSGRIVTTTDGGWHWTASNAPLTRDFNKIYFINDQNWIIVGGREGDSTQSPLQTILKSANGGQSWSVALDQAGFWLRSVHFATASVGFAVGDSGTILKTTDGGANWNPIVAPIQRNFNAIWFKDSNNGFIAGGYPAHDSIRTILQTTNGGNTWTIKLDERGSMLRDVHFADANTGYAVGDYATVLKTTNSGQAWSPVVIPGTLGDEQFNAVRFYDSSFGYVSGKWGVQFIYNNEVAPEAVTAAAGVHDSLAVTLTGFVNSHDEIAAYGFVFTNDWNGPRNETAYKGIIKNDTFTFISETFTELSPDTLYYYYFEAFTKGGHVRGDTLTFRTGSATAQFATEDATDIAQNGATLNGRISGYSFPMNLFFEYGVTPAFGSQVAASPSSINGSALQSVTANISSLQSSTLYYFRLKGVSGTTNYYGNTLTFFNGAQFIALQTLPATSITDTSATLNAVVDGFQIPANISFEYSADNLSFNLSTPLLPGISDSLQHQLSTSIFNLTPATLYYFRVKAETVLGTFYGDTLLFYSRLTGNYSVKTQAATGVTSSFAQLHGEVSALPEPADLSFEYGTTIAMNNTVQSTPASISDSGTYSITAELSGLQANTLYYYRLSAEIASGVKLYGEIRQLYIGSNTIPNWDFQEWEQKTYLIPEAWNVMDEDYERVPGHLGGSALKLHKKTMATLGFLYDSGSNEPGFGGGIPLHARPDSISFYANYFIEQGDSAILLIHLYDTAYNDICTALFNIDGSSNGQFKRLSYAIPYNSGLTPDSLVIVFMPTNPDKKTNNTSYLIIDDITTSASPDVIPFGDFENWIDVSNYVLSGWFYPKHVMIYSMQPQIVSQAVFNAPNDYAAELRNVPIGNGRWIGSEISNKTFLFDKSGGFPVYLRHQNLNGYLKWLPENGDTLLITVILSYQGQSVGGGQLIMTSAVTDFTSFDVPITYDAPGVIPDTAQIAFRCYNRVPPTGRSRLFVDKLSFDGFVGIRENSSASGQANMFVTVYPNPAAAEIVIQLNERIARGTLTIYDLQGALIYSKDFSGNSIKVDTRSFPKGLYIAAIEQNKKRVTSKFIVVK